jgi:heavy metal sensor kinase
MKLRIQTRLTLWYAGSLTLLILVFGLLIDGLMQRRLIARTDFEIDEELQELALEVRVAPDRTDLIKQLELRFGNHESFEFVVQTPAAEPVFISRRISDPDQGQSLTLAGKVTPYQSVRLAHLGNCRIGSKIAESSMGPLSIAVVLPLDRSLAELKDLRLLLLIVSPIVVVIAIGGGYWLSGRALRPIGRMIATAADISAHQTDRRLEVVHDDELGRLAMTLNAMLDRLRNALKEMRQFTEDAAHELRTPLAVIRSTAEVALRHSRPAMYYEESLQAIVEEADRLTDLSNQLLILAREGGGLHPTESTESVDLASVVQDVVLDFDALAESRNVQLNSTVMPPLQVIGNTDRLRRVFLNLLDNAVKYTPAGGSIHLDVECWQNTIEVVIRDTGIGIAPEHIPHLFDRFYRVDASHNRETGGAGLGLAICRAIVTSHGGQLTLRSEVGIGTEVRVCLPRPARATNSRDPSSVRIYTLEEAEASRL